MNKKIMALLAAREAITEKREYKMGIQFAAKNPKSSAWEYISYRDVVEIIDEMLIQQKDQEEQDE